MWQKVLDASIDPKAKFSCADDLSKALNGES